MEQVSMFDGATRYTIDKPIRLIELFAGYGSQSLALKYLGVPFEHWKISEWAIKSIFAYKNVHFPNDNKDYSGNMTADDLRGYLLGKISGNYNEPLSAKQLKRKRESELREIYNAMEASHNLGSIVGVNGDDLQILDIDKFTYLLTYLQLSLSRFKYGRLTKRNAR